METTKRRRSKKAPEKIVVDFGPPATQVWMRGKTHSYLWIRDEFAEGVFLTMDSGSISLVKLPMIVPENGGKEHTYRVQYDREDFEDLTPIAYDFRKAVERYHTSLLARSTQAEAEMRVILGLEALKEGETLPGAVPPPKRAPKPAKAPSEVREKQPGGYSLQTLCEELKLDPTEARKALRAAKAEKPGGRWEWPNAEAAAAVRAILEKLQ